MRCFLVLILLVLLPGTLTGDEVIDTATIITLHEAGLAPEVIVNKIQSAGIVRFRNTTEELLQLGKAGVPGTVIEALQRRATTETAASETTTVVAEVSRAYADLPKEIGIFLVIDTRVVPIEQQTVKHGFVGVGLAKGMLGLRKVVVPHYVEGGQSKLAVPGPLPVLLVNLPGEKLGDLKLVRALKVTNDRRELFNAQDGFFTAKEVESREIGVKSNPIRDGYYELTPAESLTAGEYAIADYGVEGSIPRAWPFRVTSAN